MSWLWAASGPLVEPSNRSGVTDWDGCSHVSPASCASCDGAGADERELEDYLADLAAWNNRREERAAARITWPWLCSLCGLHARWRIGARHASCDQHLRRVIGAAYAYANGVPPIPTGQESA